VRAAQIESGALNGCIGSWRCDTCLSWTKRCWSSAEQMRQHAKTVPVSLAYSMMMNSVILIIIAIVRMLRRIVAVSLSTTDPGQFLPRITLTSRSPADRDHNTAAGNWIAGFRTREAEMTKPQIRHADIPEACGQRPSCDPSPRPAHCSGRARIKRLANVCKDLCSADYETLLNLCLRIAIAEGWKL
jgi:hypothetical protein